VIFLTVGTWHRGYDRLVKAVDDLVACGLIKDKVIAQIGCGAYKAKHLMVMDFCSPNKFVNIISSSRLVISHAGIGTISQAIKLNKPVVVMPRKISLGEVDNSHQYATARQLEAEGKILVAYEVSDLLAKLKEARAFVPTRGEGCDRILNTVQEFIDNVAEKKLGYSRIGVQKNAGVQKLDSENLAVQDSTKG